MYYRDGALEVERTIPITSPIPRKHWLTDEFRAVVEAIIAINPKPVLYAEYGVDVSPES
jgi:hypothetical protein